MSTGSDFWGVEDLDPLLTFLEGDSEELTALSQALMRRFTMPRGALWYAPGEGLDLRMFLSDLIPPQVVEQAVAAEARKDERVDDCTCTIVVQQDQSWVISINPQTTTGATYTLTVAVSQVSVQLLSAQPSAT